MVLKSRLIRAVDNLRTALALGAERAIHVLTNEEIDQVIQPIHVAKIIKSIIEKEKYDFAILGKQAIDDDYNQTGQMLAALLNWPQATFISKIEHRPDENAFYVEREIDGGIQKLLLPINSIITCDLRLNKPRLPKLPDIMKAKKKNIEVLNIETFDLKGALGIKISEFNEPPKRKGGVIVNSVDELIDKLRNQAKVI